MRPCPRSALFAAILLAALTASCSAAKDDPSPSFGDSATADLGSADSVAGDWSEDVSSSDTAADHKPLPEVSPDAEEEEDGAETDFVSDSADGWVEPDAAEVVLGCQDDSDCYGLHCLVEEGICVGCTSFTECDDGNQCTFDYCAEIHECVNNPVEGACEDGNSCTLGDHCEDGACIPESVVECSDDNPCTDEVCPAGECAYEPNTNLCEDGDPCTVGDVCAAGACTPGPDQLPCDDLNTCTTDTCVQLQGCIYAFAEGACDDGNSCTGGDHCSDGACIALTTIPCDDGDQCTASECTPDGGCTHTPTPGVPCDDGDPCTKGEKCGADQSCGGGAVDACDDSNDCSVDTCDPVAGCQNVLVDGLECQDSNECTDNDICVGGTCQGSQVSCDDNNVCTADGCSAVTGECFHEPTPATCDDGNPCTDGDGCLLGKCIGGKPTVCDDGNPCTQDSCDAASGCTAKPAAGPCDDGNPCTESDVCKDGTCSGVWKTCQTPNPCATASCDPLSGVCVYKPLDNVPCSDGNACTGPDVCKLGQCATTSITCNDGNQCTDDKCDALGGCIYAPKNGVGCDDGNPCSANDQCVNGTCIGQGAVQCNDNNVCTDDTCGSSGGGLVGCVYTPKTGGGCDDGNSCTISDSCVAGTCTGTPVACGDGNQCTDDVCVPGAGCQYPPKAGGGCDDGNACTAGDSCANGQCVGAGVGCNDWNGCTDDWCDPGSGCVYSPLTGPTCNDGNACTTGDACLNGVCTGAKLTCNDGNSCTKNQCLPESGCYFPSKDWEACDDSNPCTEGDYCYNSACYPGSNVCECDSDGDCNDWNDCTTDYCSDHKCNHAIIPNCGGVACCKNHCGGQSDCLLPGSDSKHCWCDWYCKGAQDCCSDSCTYCNLPFCD